MKKKLLAALLAVLALAIAAVTVFAADTPAYTVDENGNITLDVELYLIGDVSGDGVVNIADTTLLNRSLLPETHAAYAEIDVSMADIADVNGDGVVNIADTTLINRSLLPTTHPAYAPIHN